MADRGRRAPVDVYLFPAPLGGGRGDIDEVFVAGETLARAGARVRLFRLPGRSLPPAVADRRLWPPVPRVTRIGRRRPWAVTVSAAWGVTAAPRRPGPLGGAGPWAEESATVEDAYGADRTVHVSIEEFARTLTAREQSVERYREGGRTAREIERIARTRRFDREVREFHRAFRRFRGFDVPNVLAVFPGFVRSGRFQREYPEAVQTGPLMPRRYRRSRRIRSSGRWLWYADSLSATRIGRGIAEGLARSPRSVSLEVRFASGDPGPEWGDRRLRRLPPLPPSEWSRRFRDADLRIVTGSRSLLEALELGGPFLYFNGATGTGRRTRRHRPEKFRQLLRALDLPRRADAVRRDLRAFASARRIPSVVDAATRDRWRSAFPREWAVHGYTPPFTSANALFAAIVQELRDAGPGDRGARDVVRSLRTRSDSNGPGAGQPNP